MSQFSISLNVSENDYESRVGTGVHGHLFNDRLGWPTTPDTALIPQCPSSFPTNDGTYMKPLTHHPCDYVRLLAVSNHISSGLLTRYSYPPVASQMTRSSVTWTFVPPTLQQHFLTQRTHTCIALVTARTIPKGPVWPLILYNSDWPLTDVTHYPPKARAPLSAYHTSRRTW